MCRSLNCIQYCWACFLTDWRPGGLRHRLGDSVGGSRCTHWSSLECFTGQRQGQSVILYLFYGKQNDLKPAVDILRVELLALKRLQFINFSNKRLHCVLKGLTSS